MNKKSIIGITLIIAFFFIYTLIPAGSHKADDTKKNDAQIVKILNIDQINTLKIKLINQLAFSNKSGKSTIPILMYHSIRYEAGNSARMSKEKFELQMKWLSDNGYTTLTMEELYNHLSDKIQFPAKSVVVTLDDGYRDCYTNAFPILKKYKIHATVFVISNRITSQSEDYLTEEQIKELSSSGFVDIQCHTVHHPKMDELSYNKQYNELNESKIYLEKLMGKAVEYFCFPSGRSNADTLKALKALGFKLSFKMSGGLASIYDDPYKLKRIYIGESDNIDSFQKKISNEAALTKDEMIKKSLEEQYEKGHAVFMSGKYQEAIDIENAIIEKDPTNYMAYNVKGIALCYAGNFKKGMANIDKALELKPDFGYARFNKALAYELYRYYDDAIKWYNKDLEIEEYAWSYYGIASIYGRWGDVDNTVSYLKLAFALLPAAKEEAKTEKDFNPVRGKPAFEDLLNIEYNFSWQE